MLVAKPLRDLIWFQWRSRSQDKIQQKAKNKIGDENGTNRETMPTLVVVEIWDAKCQVIGYTQVSRVSLCSIEGVVEQWHITLCNQHEVVFVN